MKSATKAMIEKVIAPYIQRDGLTMYLRSGDIEDITYEILSNYSNVYCSSTNNESGSKIFSVSNKSRHVKYIEIIVR